MTALTVCGPVPAAAPPDLRDAKVTLEALGLLTHNPLALADDLVLSDQVLAIEELADHHAQGQPEGEYLAFL